jgi:hypothetical protein
LRFLFLFAFAYKGCYNKGNTYLNKKDMFTLKKPFNKKVTSKKSTSRINPKKLRLFNFVLLFALIGTLFLHFTLAASAGYLYNGGETVHVSRINQHRASRGLSALTWSGCLTNAAREWAKVISDSNYLRHSSNAGSDIVTKWCGNWGYGVAENVGGFHATSSLAMDDYIASPGHRANIEGNYSHVGAGVWKRADGGEASVHLFAQQGNGAYGNFNQAVNANPSPKYVADEPTTNNPKGNLENATCDTVSGWVFDPDQPASSLEVHIYVDGPAGAASNSFNTGPTTLSRPDVNAAFRLTGNHGFSWKMPTAYLDGKKHTFYVYGINVGAGSGHWVASPSIHCYGPTGNVETANCRRIVGWSFDRQNPNISNQVHIYIDGEGIATVANLARPDVNSAFGTTGDHGFDFTVPEKFRDGRTHTAIIYGISTTGAPNPALATKTLDACANPIGNNETVSCTATAGWTLDMNDPARSIDVHVYADGGLAAYGTANQSRPDVNNAYRNYGVAGNHGFTIALPSRLKDGRQHTINTYAINVGNGVNVLLKSQVVGPCN